MSEPDVISLECISSHWPGNTWTSRVRAEHSNGKTSVKMSTSIPGGGGRYRHQKTVRSSSAFDGLVSVLVDPAGEGGIPEGCLGDVTVEGATGWQKDFLAFCWCKDENSSFIPWHIAGFSETQLTSLHAQTGRFRDLFKETAGRDQILRMIHSIDDIYSEEEPCLWVAAALLDMSEGVDFWQDLERTLEAKANAINELKADDDDRRKQQMVPFENYAKLASMTRLGGSNGVAINLFRHASVVKYIARVHQATGSLPRGKHSITYSVPAAANPGGVKLYKMDVTFPADFG